MANTNLPGFSGLRIQASNGTNQLSLVASDGVIPQLNAAGQAVSVAVKYPSIPCIGTVEVPTHATATYDFPLAFPCRIVGFYAIKIGNGGAGDSFLLNKVALDGTVTAISGATDLHINDKLIAPALGLSSVSFAAGEKVQVAATQASDAACSVFFTVLPL